MNKNKFIIPILSTVYGLTSIVSPVYAQGQNVIDIGKEVESTNFFGYKCVMDLLYKGIDAAIIISGIILLTFLVYGGSQWMLSGADKGKVENAQKTITNALIGVALIATSYAIWKIVLTFFGINAPNICGPNPLS